jgi:hypothetical protein
MLSEGALCVLLRAPAQRRNCCCRYYITIKPHVHLWRCTCWELLLSSAWRRAICPFDSQPPPRAPSTNKDIRDPHEEGRDGAWFASVLLPGFHGLCSHRGDGSIVELRLHRFIGICVWAVEFAISPHHDTVYIRAQYRCFMFI